MLTYLVASCSLPVIESQGHVSSLVDMRSKNWTSTALTLLMLLFYHNLLRLYYTKRSRDIASHGTKSLEGGGVDSGFAYVFYATADLYACSTLVNIQRLRDLNSTIPIHVLASEYLSIPYMDALVAANVTVHVEETPQMSGLSGGYYQDCLLKLLAFKMHKLDPSLKRVIMFDSDQLILKHFDHLFSDIPSVDLAAPRAYWLPPGDAPFSSAFMLITLSDRLWEQINQTFPSDDLADQGPVRADMEVLNDEFRETAMILSGEYVTLNSHWEDWNIPNWFHPEASSPLLNRTSLPVPDLSEFVDQPSVEPQSELNVQDIWSQEPKKPAPRFPADSEIFQNLLQLHEYASIVHFTGLGKPWTYNVQEVFNQRQDAHPSFALQFGMWRKVAGDVCPEDWDIQ